MKVKVINKSQNKLPEYETPKSAGLDLRADIPDSITLFPREHRLIPTGLYVALPEGYEAQVRPRSGLAFKHGITVLNSPGTIDADYRGNIGVILINLGDQAFKINPGDRIAQLVLNQISQIQWELITEFEESDKTERGEGGYGHTGKN